MTATDKAAYAAACRNLATQAVRRPQPRGKGTVDVKQETKRIPARGRKR